MLALVALAYVILFSEYGAYPLEEHPVFSGLAVFARVGLTHKART